MILVAVSATTVVTAASATIAATVTATATAITAAVVSAATTATVATVATSETTATALWAFFAWACFVDCQCTTKEFLTIEAFDGCIHLLDSFHGHESEATWAARLAVFYDENVGYRTVCFEKLADITISCVVGQIAYIHLCIH
jgi:hypothetical protein